jgi:Holliday junction DNA helicase RuvB
MGSEDIDNMIPPSDGGLRWDRSANTSTETNVLSSAMVIDESEQDDANVVGRQQNLRPSVFDDYIGQGVIKENVAVSCRAARSRGEPLDHVLLHGPPGLGKTSLALVLSRELGVEFTSTSGPVLERPGDLAAILTTLQAGQILFIDEIHRLPRVVEEVLYGAMEDFQLDIMIGQGASARSVRVPLKPFTLVGATTRSGMLTSPLRDRFGMVYRLQFYSEPELAQIVTRSAAILALEIDGQAALEIGRRSRGTPRIANRLLKRVRDYAQDDGEKRISVEIVRYALERLEIDERGLDAMDRQILALLIDAFGGGPVGVESLAAALGEERATLEDVYEPYLIQSGFIVRTRAGRKVSASAFQHLGRDLPEDVQRQQALFGDRATQDNAGGDNW